MGRRRRYGSTDPNKVGTIRDPVINQFNKLLSSYYRTLADRFPLGPFNDKTKSEISTKAWDTLLMNNKTFKLLVEQLSVLDPDKMENFLNLTKPGVAMELHVNLWLRDVAPQRLITPHCHTHKVRECLPNAMPPEMWIAGSTFDDFGMNLVQDPVTKAWRRTHIENGNRYFSDTVETAEEATYAGLLERQRQEAFAVLSFVVPVIVRSATPAPCEGMRGHRYSGGESHERATPTMPRGYYADPDNSIWILPDHPDYDVWHKWGAIAYTLDARVQWMRACVAWMCDANNTIGQLRRVFPDLINFVDGESKAKLMNAKAQSPLPEQLSGMNPFEKEAMYLRRAKRIKEVARILGEVGAQCMLMPRPDSAQDALMRSINSNFGFCNNFPTGSVWNTFN